MTFTGRIRWNCIQTLKGAFGLWDSYENWFSVSHCDFMWEDKHLRPQVLKIPMRTCTDMQLHAVMQMELLWCLVLQCCISKFVVLNRLLLFLTTDLNPITAKKQQKIHDFKTPVWSCVVNKCCGLIWCSALPKSKVCPRPHNKAGRAEYDLGPTTCHMALTSPSYAASWSC